MYVYHVADTNVSDRRAAGNCSGPVDCGEQQSAGDSDPPLPMCYTRSQPPDTLWLSLCNHSKNGLFWAKSSVFDCLVWHVYSRANHDWSESQPL